MRELRLVVEKCGMLFRGTLWSAMAVLYLTACAKSPSPSISPSVKIDPPKFDGNITKLTTATQAFTLTGTCDSDVDGLQYSLDGTTWSDVGGGCTTTGTFTLRANVNRTMTVSVRAKVKIFFSEPAQVVVSFVPPPTSTTLTFVSSSNSNSDRNPNVVNTLGHNFSGQSLNNGQVALKTYLPRMIYETQ